MVVLENRLAEEKKLLKASETKLANFSKNLDTVLGGIGDVFKLLKCDKAPLLELLGRKAP